MAYMTFQFRRDTAANWTAANPILASGELGLETDTRKMKFGDGATAWNSLAYWYAVAFEDLINVDTTGAVANDVLKFNGTDWVDGRVALDELSDVTITTPATGAVLQYDGAGWIDALPTTLYHGTTAVLTTGASTIDITTRSLTITDATAAAYAEIYLDGDAGGAVNFKDSGVAQGSMYSYAGDLYFDTNTGVGLILATNGAAATVTLQPNLTDTLVAEVGKVTVTRTLNVVPTAGNPVTPVNGDLWYNSTTGKFMAYQAGASFEVLDPGTLDGLTDVTITTPATDAVLRYDGAGWVDALPNNLYHGTTKVLETGASVIQVTGRQMGVYEGAGFGTFKADGSSGGSIDFYGAGVYKAALYYFSGNMVFDGITGVGLVFNTNSASDTIQFAPNFNTVLLLDSKATIYRTLCLNPTAGDPGSPANGDLWYNSTTGKFMAREAGASYELVSRPYDVGIYVQGKPTNAELVLRLEVGRAASFPTSLTGSHASARVASTGTVSFDLLKNGVSFGTVTFTTSATGTFTSASGATFAAGDVLTITAPATADATLEDISITLVGTRT